MVEARGRLAVGNQRDIKHWRYMYTARKTLNVVPCGKMAEWHAGWQGRREAIGDAIGVDGGRRRRLVTQAGDPVSAHVVGAGWPTAMLGSMAIGGWPAACLVR